MPLWLIFHPSGTFASDEEKRALSQSITKIYTSSGLPAFYVVVNFIPTPVHNMYVGGEFKHDKPFVRIAIDHIAVRQPDRAEAYRRICSRIDAALKPHVADRGYGWEYHVDETERRLWKIDGLEPPAWKSEEEKAWVKANRPVPYSNI